MKKNSISRKGLYYLWDILSNLMVTTKHKWRAETWNIKKKEETEKNIIDNYQIKMAETQGKRNNGGIEKQGNKR